MLVDDLDGSQLERGSGDTIQFGLDGRAYEPDLTDDIGQPGGRYRQIRDAICDSSSMTAVMSQSSEVTTSARVAGTNAGHLPCKNAYVRDQATVPSLSTTTDADDFRHHLHVTNYWIPQSETELLAAIKSGNATENRHLDFKQDIGDSDSSRKETARDLASFALYGGVLIIGVSEPISGRFELSPVPLVDASERVEQIAATRPEPTIHVRTTQIPSAGDAALGYLVVEIPASPSAPHMVDGRYWGRAERTKRQLSDREVVRLHSQLEDESSRVRDALDEEVLREPLPQIQSRMFLVAVPLHADEGMGRAFIRGEHSRMRSFSEAAESSVPSSVITASPIPSELHSTVRRARGIARTNLAEGRIVGDHHFARYAADIEVQKTGSVRLLVSGTTDIGTVPRIPEPTTLAITQIPVAWTFRLVGYASRIAQDTGYRGSWGFGIRMGGLEGARAWTDDRRAYALPVYEESHYEGVSVASLREAENSPGVVVERLVGDLLHGLGVADCYDEWLK